MNAAPLLLAICLAAPVMSQTLEDEPWIDFDLLFTRNADAITYKTDGSGPAAVLTLPGEVRVERRGAVGSYTYRSFDCSPDGNAGELLVVVLALRDSADRCPGFATPEQIVRLDRLLDRLGPYVAENTAPPQTWAALHPQLISLLPREQQLTCQAILSDNSWSDVFLHNILRDELKARFDALLAVPKLPVMSRCN
jgi:hypothetical protein